MKPLLFILICVGSLQAMAAIQPSDADPSENIRASFAQRSEQRSALDRARRSLEWIERSLILAEYPPHLYWDQKRASLEFRKTHWMSFFTALIDLKKTMIQLDKKVGKTAVSLLLFARYIDIYETLASETKHTEEVGRGIPEALTALGIPVSSPNSLDDVQAAIKKEFAL